jgi:hypothetical protein
MEWLPQINGFGIGVILAAVLEVGKIFGLHEDDTGKVALGLGILWAAVALVAQEYPATTSWVTMVFQILLAVAAVPIGAKTGYKAVIQPANKKAWNRVR